MLAVKSAFLCQVRLLESKNESMDSSNGDEEKGREEEGSKEKIKYL